MECRIRFVKGKKLGQGGFHAAFKYGGIEYTRSLRTKDGTEAESRLGTIRDTLYRPQRGILAQPVGADPKLFGVSGGQQTEKSQATPRLTIDKMATLDPDALKGVESNTRLTLTIHLNHAKRLLGEETSVSKVQLADAGRYAKKRLAEKHRGKSTQAYTVRKELRTFRRVWVWGVEHQHAPTSPTWEVKAVKLPKDRGRESSRTYEQIPRILKRGGVKVDDEKRLWECPASP